jgi:hypothetical protein
MIKLGVIGISDGNGHPFSWSAIFNGFNPQYAALCPYPIIVEYLSERTFPDEQIQEASVVAVWTQEPSVTDAIARFANVPIQCSSLEEMLPLVDAVLLARDDAETHADISELFLREGIPVYVDKPFAFNYKDANRMWNTARYEWQVFTCSALRFASELKLQDQYLQTATFAEGFVSKRWDKYGIHILEPCIQALPNRGKLINVINSSTNDESDHVFIEWENARAELHCLGKEITPIHFTFRGDSWEQSVTFRDTFSCFKSALECFVQEVVAKGNMPIPRAETQEILHILIQGTIR